MTNQKNTKNRVKPPKNRGKTTPKNQKKSKFRLKLVPINGYIKNPLKNKGLTPFFTHFFPRR
jgi:hypothetical protein